MVTSEQIVDEAKKWADAKVPYRHRGLSKQGCDCTGLIIGVMQALGFLSGYKLRYYPLDWNLHSGAGEFLLIELKRFAQRIQKGDLKPGDILVFKFGRCESHAGIYVGNLTFVHCYLVARRCCYGVLKNSIWASRWCDTYRWKGISFA